MTTVRLGPMVAEVTGQGFPVIMVHGLGGTSNTFQPQMAALEGFRVVRPDLPGAGRSPTPSNPLSIEWFAKKLMDGAAALGITRAHFVGHSMGTIVCQRIAADAPDLVASLTLFGALTEPPEGARTGLPGRARTARSDGMEPIADQIVASALAASTRASQPSTVAFVRESIMRQDAEGYARHCEALARASRVDPRLIGAPTLLVTGESDAVAPPSMARELGDTIAGASVTIVPGSGHWITLEKPAECNERMGDFLRRLH